jgi:predicted acyltransferase
MVLHLSVRQQVVGTAALLVGYWLLMTFVPVPGHQVGVYAPGVNFGDWLNDQILGDWQKRWRFGWILQTMTYGANAMMGVLAGHVLRSRLERKTLALVAFGLAALIVGWVGGFSLPIIKNRWTSTFVLFACGWSLLLLAAFYWVIDVRGWRRWTLPLVVVGMNPITAYMAWGLFDDAFRMMAEVFLRGLQPHLGSAYDAVAWAGATFILWWILYAMYRQRIFLRA